VVFTDRFSYKSNQFHLGALSFGASVGIIIAICVVIVIIISVVATCYTPLAKKIFPHKFWNSKPEML